MFDACMDADPTRIDAGAVSSETAAALHHRTQRCQIRDHANRAPSEFRNHWNASTYTHFHVLGMPRYTAEFSALEIIALLYKACGDKGTTTAMVL